MDCAEHDMPAPPLHYCAARLSIHSIAALGTMIRLPKRMTGILPRFTAS